MTFDTVSVRSNPNSKFEFIFQKSRNEKNQETKTHGGYTKQMRDTNIFKIPKKWVSRNFWPKHI